MRNLFRILTLSVSALTLAAVTGLATIQAEEAKVSEEALAKGKEIAFDVMQGNCLACHMITGGELPGNIGPPLIAMKARFPERDALRAQIYDARIKNPNTIMIPYGAHNVLNDEEIDLITDYIHTL